MREEAHQSEDMWKKKTPRPKKRMAHSCSICPLSMGRRSPPHAAAAATTVRGQARPKREHECFACRRAGEGDEALGGRAAMAV